MSTTKTDYETMRLAQAVHKARELVAILREAGEPSLSLRVSSLVREMKWQRKCATSIYDTLHGSDE